jgi:drug/metabolite transporter (DMT)-like permease
MYHLGAMRATNYVYVNPITTIVFAAWILDEKITPYFIFGSLFILVGLYLSNKSRSEALS